MEPAVQWLATSGAWRALPGPGTTSPSTCTAREGQTLRAPALEKEKLAKCAASREVAPALHRSLRSSASFLKTRRKVNDQLMIIDWWVVVGQKRESLERKRPFLPRRLSGHLIVVSGNKLYSELFGTLLSVREFCSPEQSWETLEAKD